MGTYNRDTGAMPNDLIGIGTIAHELGHSAYGFDDTYDYGTLTGNSTSGGLGFWSLMDAGSHANRIGERSGLTPPYVDAYNLVRYGFVTPGVLSDGDAVTVSAHNQIYMAKSDASDNQYFLIQQRKYGSAPNFDQGGFDRMSPSANQSPNVGGVLIYHLDENVPLIRLNDKPTHKYVSIEEAHGGVQHLSQSSGASRYGGVNDLWGTTAHDFNGTSDPSSNFYGAFTNDLIPPTHNTPSGISLSDITWDSASGTSSLLMGYQDPRCHIDDFRIPGQIGRTTINQQAKTIKLYMPIAADLTSLTPNIQFEGAGGINPPIGAQRDFTVPQTYRVTAANGDYSDYVVTVVLSIATDGLNFSGIYQPTSVTNQTNSLGSYIYYGHYNDGANARPRLWYVTGEEDGSLVLLQRETYANEARIFSPTTGGQTWGDSQIYMWLNNAGAISNPFTDFFRNGELSAIDRVDVNTTSYDANIARWRQIAMHRSSGTLFYLLNAYNSAHREWDSNAAFRSSVSWSASLEGFENKLINTSRIAWSSAYWLRSARVLSGYYNNVYNVWNSGTNGVSITHSSRESSGSRHVRPVFQLDLNSVVLLSEIGGSGIGSIPSGSNYIAGTSGNRNYKLTVIGGNDGADVGNVHGVPAGKVVAEEGVEYALTGLLSTPAGAGDYTINYKIVQNIAGARSIIRYGSSSDLTKLDISTSGLIEGGDYTVHVWLQRNNAVHSHEATMPQYFTFAIGVPECAHAFSAYETTTPANCESAGEETASCDYGCGETDTKPVAPLGHDLTGEPVIIDPTCIEDGSKTITCKDCGYEDIEILEAVICEDDCDLLCGFTVTFSANGGTGSMASIRVKAGGTLKTPQSAFNRSNHNFTGWNTATDGSGEAYKAGDDTNAIEANTTLYAQWVRNTLGIGPGPIIVPSW